MMDNKLNLQLNNKTQEHKKDNVNGLSNSVISFNDITCAAYRIRSHVIRTQCSPFAMSTNYNMQIYFKKEFMQLTGSFKDRGACYSLLMLSEEQKKSGVVTASLGNHSQALSYHAHNFAIPTTVVMPLIAPIVKIEACRRFGADVIVRGSNMKQVKEFAEQYAIDNNKKYINGYDDPHIIAGQGTIGLEIMEDVPNMDAVVVPVGGGGLIAGIALAVKKLNPKIKVIGVETDKCDSFSQAIKQGKPVFTEIKGTIADGLAVTKVGDNAFNIASKLIDKMVLVKEEWVSLAILRLLEQEKCVVEGAGAVGFAAILAGCLDEFKGKKVVVLLCGGNIDTSVLGKCIERGLAADGRLLKFSLNVSDRPGGISEICNILAKIGASVKDVAHERAWLTSNVFDVNLTVTCETRNAEHVAEIKQILNEKYKTVFFQKTPMARM